MVVRRWRLIERRTPAVLRQAGTPDGRYPIAADVLAGDVARLSAWPLVLRRRKR